MNTNISAIKIQVAKNGRCLKRQELIQLVADKNIKYTRNSKPDLNRDFNL